MSATDAPRVVVTAAIVEMNGRYLVTRRLAGVHLEGFWEFPGGKCDRGETLQECLLRELQEELGCGAAIGPEIFTTAHSYPERRVELHFFECSLAGEPRGVLGQELRWVAKSELRSLRFPPADEELIALLEQ